MKVEDQLVTLHRVRASFVDYGHVPRLCPYADRMECTRCGLALTGEEMVAGKLVDAACKPNAETAAKMAREERDHEAGGA